VDCYSPTRLFKLFQRLHCARTYGRSHTSAWQGPAHHWQPSPVMATNSPLAWSSWWSFCLSSVNFSEIAVQPKLPFTYRFPDFCVITGAIELEFPFLVKDLLLSESGLISLQELYNRGAYLQDAQILLLGRHLVLNDSLGVSIPSLLTFRLYYLISLLLSCLMPFLWLFWKFLGSSKLNFWNLLFERCQPHWMFRMFSMVEAARCNNSLSEDSQKRFSKRETQNHLWSAYLFCQIW